MNDVIRHYDLLIDEGNDPVLDPPELAAYMDGWDGAYFLEQLQLNGAQDVLEVGVGTGRLALRTAPLCRRLMGIDVSPMTIERAWQNLADVPNVHLVCADFLHWQPDERFDVVYSSLTFMHFPDKQRVADQTARLLAPGGRAVISLDKDQSGVIVYGDRRVRVYPDDPQAMSACLERAGLQVTSLQETERAHILTAVKGAES